MHTNYYGIEFLSFCFKKLWGMHHDIVTMELMEEAIEAIDFDLAGFRPIKIPVANNSLPVELELADGYHLV